MATKEAKKTKKKGGGKKVYFTSPIGTFQHPHLTAPDTFGEYGDGKYKTKLRVEKTAKGVTEFISFLEDMAKKLLPFTEDETLRCGYKEGTGDDEGFYIFSFSSKFQPALVGPDNKPIDLKKMPKDFNIGAGSTGRIGGELFPYEHKDGDGVSLQMKQVQLATYVKGGRQSMFEDTIEGDFNPEALEGETDVDAESAADELGL
jgi:hypothetical protein